MPRLPRLYRAERYRRIRIARNGEYLWAPELLSDTGPAERYRSWGAVPVAPSDTGSAERYRRIRIARNAEYLSPPELLSDTGTAERYLARGAAALAGVAAALPGRATWRGRCSVWT